jgi:hypothetical protein
VIEGDRAERLLAPPGDREEVPDRWTPEHVGERLKTAFEVLLRIPMQTRPKAFGTAWPRFQPEFSDLVAQSESGALGDTYEAQNRDRAGATRLEIDMMDEALAWPGAILSDRPDIAQVVLGAALAQAKSASTKPLQRRISVSPATFWRWRMQGLAIIARSLERQGVAIR